MIRVIERDRAELDVGPLGIRLGTAFASVAPQLAARLSRRAGSEAIAAMVAEGQRDKR